MLLIPNSTANRAITYTYSTLTREIRYNIARLIIEHHRDKALSEVLYLRVWMLASDTASLDGQTWMLSGILTLYSVLQCKVTVLIIVVFI